MRLIVANRYLLPFQKTAIVMKLLLAVDEMNILLFQGLHFGILPNVVASKSTYINIFDDGLAKVSSNLLYSF